MREGTISLGRLRRIESVLNTFIREKYLNPDAIFDLEKSIKYIARAKIITSPLPVKIKPLSVQTIPQSICNERIILEMQLKNYFLIPYKS
ncbi:MAG: hypothetical protein EAY66_07715 [Sphingobacteriales bacterium]|jgi:hypothetical protein|nr:MAG: hypothetical protein EAY66_07715 [Sphingobacteriales bacterium]